MGDCKPCDGGLLLLLPMLVVVLTFLPFLCSVLCKCQSRYSSAAPTVAASLAIAVTFAAQGVYGMQSLRIIRQLEIKWLDPAKSLLAALSFISIDFDILGLPCYVPESNPIATYAFQLMALPTFVLASLLPGILARMLRRPFKFRIVFNIWALLFVSLLTAITLMCFKPFECRENPNGKFTIFEYAHVLCWESNSHAMLVGISFIGILAYPVSILAWLLYLTWYYPTWLLSASGINTVEKYRFLFGKFRPERYYYCVLLSIGNLLVGCIPGCFASFPALQVGIMSFVLWARNALHCLLWPWRIEVANWSDLLLQGGVALLLSLAAPLNLEVQIGDRSEYVLTVGMSIVLVLLPASICLAAILALYFRAGKQNRYTTFISHQKASAGIFCRYLKIVMAKHARTKVFYDSDDLLNLGDLFETVRTRTESFLAVLTPGFIQSVWCVGELSMAFHCGLPIFALCCDGHKIPEYLDVNQIESSWPANEFQLLIAHGVGRAEVQAALAYLNRLEHFQLSRTAPGAEQEAVAHMVMGAILGKLGAKPDDFSTLERAAGEGEVSKARVLVASSTSTQSMSTSLVIQQLMQYQLQERVCHVFRAEEIKAAHRASSGIIVLGKGSLEDEAFSELVLAIPGTLTRLLVNDGSFEFPTHDFYRRIRDGELGLRGNPHEISATYQGLCSSLAVPLTPAGPSWLLDRQISQICRRLGRLGTETKSVSPEDFSRPPSDSWLNRPKSWLWEEEQEEEDGERSRSSYVEQAF